METIGVPIGHRNRTIVRETKRKRFFHIRDYGKRGSFLPLVDPCFDDCSLTLGTWTSSFSPWTLFSCRLFCSPRFSFEYSSHVPILIIRQFLFSPSRFRKFALTKCSIAKADASFGRTVGITIEKIYDSVSFMYDDFWICQHPDILFGEFQLLR